MRRQAERKRLTNYQTFDCWEDRDGGDRSHRALCDEHVSTATGGFPEHDRAGGDVEDDGCEEDISMCGWSDVKGRVSHHSGREELRDVVDEVFVSVHQQAS